MVGSLKSGMLNWSKQFSILCFLDSNNYPSAYTGYECLLAAGVHKALTATDSRTDMLAVLQQEHDACPDWLFGHISYDYKNVLEPRLTSAHPSGIDFTPFHFFVPVTVCYISRDHTRLTIESFEDTDTIYQAICAQQIMAWQQPLPHLHFSKRVEKDTYLDSIAALRAHIAAGDCYEVNYCTEGYSSQVAIDPLQVFTSLNALSPAPFAAYYRINDKFMMCASPERYIHRAGSRIMSQPIKGTARRGSDAAADELIKEQLRNDIKERAENVMIVDLVRNDLARCCDTGSVVVDELFGIYTFPQVHQMISTVSGTMRPGAKLTDAIRHSFPMGSMTGAPKYKVMELIERYERSRRDLFSGTIGYITPSGDFDFNVIIRSLFYNAANQYLSYQTGGAITYDSDPVKEWEEMRLKAWALERLFKEV